MSFLDDLSQFGSGMLDDVGEGFGNLVQVATNDEASKNSGTVQQPMQPVKDNHGNNVTTPQGEAMSDKTLMYVGGGILATILLVGVVVAVSK